MGKNKTYHEKEDAGGALCAVCMILGLLGRLCYLMVFDAKYYQQKAQELHEREREIKAARGEIVGCERDSACHQPHGLYDFGDPQSD